MVDTKNHPMPPANGGSVVAASPRWRSTGWTPLAYPSSAILAPAADAPDGTHSSTAANKCHLNPHFPLHKDVILAAARELLVLDGCVDGNTLSVIEEDVNNGSVNAGNSNDSTSGQQGKKRKRSASLGESTPVEGKKYMRHLLDDCDAADDAGAKVVHLEGKEKATLPAAEDVAFAVLKRAIAQTGLNEEGLFRSLKDMPGDDNAGVNKAPRKVSDADADHIVAASATHPPTIGGLHSLPPSLTILVSNGYHVPSNAADTVIPCGEKALSPTACDSTALTSSDKIPPLVDISISGENYLREKAYEMTRQMSSSFETFALRAFLGYKSCSMKRDRVLQVMSDFLFDVSHAMFAWEQTEREILLERDQASQSSPTPSLWNEELETRVRNALFDHRALKKIGGFDSSSLLPHALSVNRARGRGMSWREFAVTGVGRKMLRHHREGSAAIVGQKRRGQRPRNRSGLNGGSEDERGTRSRSSSITSISDGSECQNEKATCNMPCYHSDDGGTNALVSGSTSINIVPDLIRLTLKREKGNSWGVKLAKEGTMCVVDKAPEGNTSSGKELGLQSGDLIVSVKNERGELACSPPSSALQDAMSIDGRKLNSQDWFRDAVNLFKTSNTLHLEVRRVKPVSMIA